MRTEVRHTAARLWPHLRVLFIAFHAIAVAALSLPSPSSVASRASWNTANNKRAMKIWSERLSWLGYGDPDQFEADLWAFTQGYVAIRRTFIRPFLRYADLTGAYQGWRMFAIPQRHPAEMHIDIRGPSMDTDGGSPTSSVDQGEPWRPIYRPHSDQYTYWRSQLTHNRLRKTQGRFARSSRVWLYHLVANYLAVRIARDHPDASEIRFRLYRYTTRTPEQVRAGQPKAGRYTDERRYRADLLRAGVPPASAQIPVPRKPPRSMQPVP